MLNFVKSAFRKLFGVLLWINLVGSVVAGAVLGYMGDDNGIMGGIFGLIGGAIVGALTTILGGGLIANFLELVNDTTAIKAKVGNIEARIDRVKADLANISEASAGTLAVFQKMGGRGGAGAQTPTP